MKSETHKKASEKNAKILTEYESKNLLREYGIGCPREIFTEIGKSNELNLEEFLAKLEREKNKLRPPFYLKICSREILHKTDAGVVKKVDTREKIPETAKELLEKATRYNPEAEIQGIIVSEDVSGEEIREMILGATTDKQFGHIVSLGIGGINVEVYKDIELRAVPITEEDVYDMIRNLRGKKILYKFRGRRPVKKELLVSKTLKFAKMIEKNPEIKEADINPLMVGPKRVIAADALIKIS